MSRSVKQDYPPKRAFAKGGLVPKAEWKAGDKAYSIKLDNGYLYINKEAADRYGLDLLSKINGQGITEVTVVEP